MKPKTLNLSLITLLLLLTGAGCKDDELLETDPSQIILGKWETIEIDGEPVEQPLDYKEYLPDSILCEYEYETGEYYYKKYWIDATLHENVYVSKGVDIPFFEYKYYFTDRNNKMHLELMYWMANQKHYTLKRIN